MKYILLMLLTAAFSSQAAHAKTDLTYKVFAGGVNAVEAKMSLDTSKKDYKLFFEAKTRGFLAKLAPWSGSFESFGNYSDKKGFYPEKHTSISTWRGEKESKQFLYDSKGGFKKLVITEGATVKPSDTIDKKYTTGTTDILAATMNVMRTTGPQKKCEGMSEIFDGKRRFKLWFKDAGTETLTKSRYNIYDGVAIKCSVEVEPISGKWHEKPRGWMSIQEQGREKGILPTVWMGTVKGTDLYVPVKVRVKTDYGTLFMHLKSVDNSNSTK